MSNIAELRNKGRQQQRKRADSVNGNGSVAKRALEARRSAKKDAVDLANLGGNPGERRSLSHRQWLFVVNYLTFANGTKAAIKAGYSERSAGQQAHHLLKQPNIQAAMEVMKEAVLSNTEISIERLVEELTDIALTDTDIKGSDKLSAIKMLFDYHYKVVSPNGQPVQLVVTYENERDRLDSLNVIDADVIEESSDE